MLGCFEILEQVEHILGYGSPILPTVSVQTSLASQVFTFFQTNDSRERERRGSCRKSVSVSKIFLNKKIKFYASPFYPALVGTQKSFKQVNICLPYVFFV